jgi:hypothetical protein
MAASSRIGNGKISSRTYYSFLSYLIPNQKYEPASLNPVFSVHVTFEVEAHCQLHINYGAYQ